MPTDAILVPTNATFMGLGKEVTRGTAVAATDFIPIRTITSPNDLAHYTPDTGMRGSAVKTYDQIATQTWAEPSYGGDAFVDTIGLLLDAIMGEVSSIGSTPSSGTTLAAGASIGANSVSTTATIGSPGTFVQIGTGTSAETFTVLTVAGSGPFTITFAAGQVLRFAHLSGAAIVPVVSPFVHTFNVLNTAPFQCPTYTISDYNGEETFQIPGSLLEELSFKYSATGLVEYTSKWKGFKSSTTSKPTQSYSTEAVKAAYTGATTLGGVASSLLQDGTLVLKRTVDPVTSVNGTQNPASIWNGGDLTCTGTMNLIYTSITEYNKYLNNTATTVDIAFALGAGSTLRTIEFQMDKVLYTAAPHTRTKSYGELPVTFEAVANVTDIGGSGGYGPLKALLTNARSAY